MRVRRLAMMLSGLEHLQCPSAELEQYTTDGDLAARWLTDISTFGDLNQESRVVDLGSGNGILGLGALALGVRSAILIDADKSACDVSQSNAEKMGFIDSATVIQARIGIDPIGLDSADLVISNPPWGRQSPKADRPFLDEVLSNRLPTHLMHSAEASHIEPLFESRDWLVERYGEADFPLPATYSHHSRQRGKTRAAFWRLTPI